MSNHDEKTTEIETRNSAAKSNVVRVDFASAALRNRRQRERGTMAPPPLPPMPQPPPDALPWLADLDVRSPWVLRLLAVVLVLLLSMLVL